MTGSSNQSMPNCAAVRAELGVPTDAAVVGSVGLPDWRKDPEHLLRAAARLGERRGDRDRGERGGRDEGGEASAEGRVDHGVPLADRVSGSSMASSGAHVSSHSSG